MFDESLCWNCDRVTEFDDSSAVCTINRRLLLVFIALHYITTLIPKKSTTFTSALHKMRQEFTFLTEMNSGYKVLRNCCSLLCTSYASLAGDLELWGRRNSFQYSQILPTETPHLLQEIPSRAPPHSWLDTPPPYISLIYFTIHCLYTSYYKEIGAFFVCWLLLCCCCCCFF